MPKITVISLIPLATEDLRHERVVRTWTNRKNNELGDNLARLTALDAARIRKKLSTVGASTEAQHIFFEVIVGAFLARLNLAPRYEFALDGRTPDWFVRQPDAIFEVVNIDPATSVINGMRGDSTFAFLSERVQQLWNALRDKTTKYEKLVASLEVPYIVAICPNLAASLDVDDCLDALGNEEYGTFADARHVSGCLWYELKQFYYIPNPHAKWPWEWRSVAATDGEAYNLVR